MKWQSPEEQTADMKELSDAIVALGWTLMRFPPDEDVLEQITLMRNEPHNGSILKLTINRPTGGPLYVEISSFDPSDSEHEAVLLTDVVWDALSTAREKALVQA